MSKVDYYNATICGHCQIIYSRDIIICSTCGSSLSLFEEFILERRREKIESLLRSSWCEDCDKCDDCERIDGDELPSIDICGGFCPHFKEEQS